MILTKKPPYTSTNVDPDRTRMEIDRLLRGYGVSGIQWTTDYANNKVELAFTVEIEVNGMKRQIGFKMQPPTFAAQHKTWMPNKGKYEVVWAPNWAQSMRLLFYWLKAKLEAVAYGLTTVEKEFLSQAIVNLPTGEQTTVGEALGQSVMNGRLSLEDKKKPDEVKPKPKPFSEDVIEAAVVEESTN